MEKLWEMMLGLLIKGDSVGAQYIAPALTHKGDFSSRGALEK